MVEFPAVTICNHNKLRRSKINGTHYENIKKVDSVYKSLKHPEDMNLDLLVPGDVSEELAGEYCIYFD